MVHRALLGSLERFFGVMIEHYAGAFPIWLSPVQARVMTITDRHDDWARQVLDILRKEGVRADLDLRNEKLGKKIREAQLEKIPYMLVLGDKEVAEKNVSPRTRRGETLEAMTVEEFVELLKRQAQEEKMGGVTSPGNSE